MPVHIEELTKYPLTSARGVELEMSQVAPNGLQGDRMYVVYDPETFMRVGSRPDQAPDLHRIEPHINGVKSILILNDETGLSPVGCIDLNDCGEPNGSNNVFNVDEFGQATDCLDMGDRVAEELSSFLRKPVRLARKTLSWLNAARDTIPPRERATAPLHIVNKASVEVMAESLGIDTDIAKRFRPNIVVSGADAFDELNWDMLCVNGIYMRVHRRTMRCPVPGLDPLTGENLKDVPKGYPELFKQLSDKGKLKPVFGVYAYPLLHTQDARLVNVGDQVEINKGW